MSTKTQFKYLIFLLLFCIFPFYVSAEPLSHISSSTLVGNLSKNSNKYTLTIESTIGKKSKLSKKNTKSFLLNKPLRLVIDISGHKTTGLKQVAVKDEFISALRIGDQKNASRFVVEMSSEETPIYAVQEKNGKLIFTIRQPGLDLEHTPNKETEQKQEKIKIEPILEKTPEPTAKEEKLAEPIKETSSGVAETEKEPSPKVDAIVSGTVDRLYFQKTPNNSESALVLEVTKLNKYSLVQKDQTRFEIKLEQMKLAGKHVELPQFPPDTFGGFQVVTPRSDGDHVIINIYVDEGTKLIPYVASGRLWVKISK